MQRGMPRDEKTHHPEGGQTTNSGFIVIHNRHSDCWHEPLVKIESAQVVKIGSAPTGTGGHCQPELGAIDREKATALEHGGPSPVDHAGRPTLYERSPTTFRLRMSSTPDTTTTSAIPTLLGKSAICELLSVSPRCLEMMVRDGDFPPPVQLGRHVYWTQAAVNNWYSSVFSAQENWAPSIQRAPQVSPRF
jgi:predicted DNA-binding transcriptional regulator AlpA